LNNTFLAQEHIQSLAKLRDVIPNPGSGLPDAVFDFALDIVPMINVDLLIEEKGKVLLAWREDRWGSGWHVVGGIIRVHETIADRIRRTAHAELSAVVGFEAAPVAMTQFFSKRGHFLSLLFRCRVTSGPAPIWAVEDGPPQPGALAWFSAPPAQIYSAHADYIPRLPPFASDNALGLAEGPVHLT
jgi:colanic acid biosynthesis protein WcaH